MRSRHKYIQRRPVKRAETHTQESLTQTKIHMRTPPAQKHTHKKIDTHTQIHLRTHTKIHLNTHIINIHIYTQITDAYTKINLYRLVHTDLNTHTTTNSQKHKYSVYIPDTHIHFIPSIDFRPIVL